MLAHPALDAVRPWADRLARAQDWPEVPELDALLRDRLREMSLEPQAAKRRRGALDRASLYVVRIHDAHRIPTRARSWHDLLNALVWAGWPRAKRALTARQRVILERRVPEGASSLPGARTREEDALAMIDEGGIVIAARDRAACEAAQREGQLESIAGAIARGECAAHVFGHAILEHAIAGESVRGYALVLESDDPRDVDRSDHALAAFLETASEALLAPARWRALALEALAPAP